MSPFPAAWCSQLREDGFLAVSAAEMPAHLAPFCAMESGVANDAAWDTFADSWNRLAPDPYLARKQMARRRRHGRFEAVCSNAATPPVVRRTANGPHYQSLTYNPLQGGIKRHFEPIEGALGDSATLCGLIGFGAALFHQVAQHPSAAQGDEAARRRWAIETHQFRITPTVESQGYPTPEGSHRDGVDFVLVMMVHRQNLREGTTTITDAAGNSLGAFTLTDRFDVALVDDRRVWHGVTPVHPVDPNTVSHRDVIVITYVDTKD